MERQGTSCACYQIGRAVQGEHSLHFATRYAAGSVPPRRLSQRIAACVTVSLTVPPLAVPTSALTAGPRFRVLPLKYIPLATCLKSLLRAEDMTDQTGRPRPTQPAKPTRHSVRSVADLLCGGPGAVQASSVAPSAAVASTPSPATPRPRGVWTRGARGRFVERPLGTPLPLPAQRAAGVAKRASKKYYSNPGPSAHCHVCARTSKSVRFAACARVRDARCRKVVCERCFTRFGWDWAAAADDPAWTCTHCRGVCPPGRSQCYIYARVNAARERKRGVRAKGARAATGPGLKSQRRTAPRTGAAAPAIGPPVQTRDQAGGSRRGGQLPRFGDPGFASQKEDARLPASRLLVMPLSSAMCPSSCLPPLLETVYSSRRPKSAMSGVIVRNLPSPLSDVTSTHSGLVSVLLRPTITLSSHSAACRQ